MRTQSYGELKW